jgi:hypothetical protein
MFLHLARRHFNPRSCDAVYVLQGFILRYCRFSCAHLSTTECNMACDHVSRYHLTSLMRLPVYGPPPCRSGWLSASDPLLHLPLPLLVAPCRLSGSENYHPRDEMSHVSTQSKLLLPVLQEKLVGLLYRVLTVTRRR